MRPRVLRKRAKIAGVGNVLALAAIMMASSSHARAMEKLNDHKSICTFPAFSEALSTDKDKLSNVFESRWPSTTHDFALGADGVLRPMRGSVERPDTDSSYTLLDRPKIDAGLTRKLSQNDTTITDAKRPSAAECGPSEANPEIVKALVDAAAARHGVDVTFAEAVAWSESGFDRRRNSPKGARGAMQLMPATAVELGVRDVCDPVDNIDGGVRHLRAMLDEFENPLLAAAAYNAGTEAIYRYGGIPPYPETVSFVTRVVNFTLGLEPSKGHARAMRRQVKETTADVETGVITARKPGAFIGGVMQF